MASSTQFASTSGSGSAPGSDPRLEVTEIDHSLKPPVIFFLTSAVLWLLLSSLFSLIVTGKLHAPSFLSNIEYLTFGRVRPAQVNAFVYGWGFNVAFAVGFWLISRLSRTVLPYSGLLVVAGMFWNLGVTIGVGGILWGDSTSIEFLEMPGYSTPLIFIADVLITVWAFVAFREGKSTYSYISKWYLFAALLWFPWFYSVAQIMLVFEPARGTVQSIVAAWYTGNLFQLWFGPVGLAAIYYFLPKVLGRPVANYHLAALGFWILAIFASWSGPASLLGSPVPAWVQAAGVGATLMLLVPIFIVAINFLGPIFGQMATIKQSASLRFVAFGAVSFILAGVIAVVLSTRSVSEILHFTLATQTYYDHVLYAFFSMVMFGAVYYFLPRVVVKEWLSALLINVHFYGRSWHRDRVARRVFWRNFAGPSAE